MIFTIISGITLVLSLLKVKFSLFGFEFDIAWIAIILSGTPMLWMAIYGLFTRLDIKAGVLVSLALIAAVYINAYFAAGEVAFIMMVGELLENSTMRKAREGLSGLISLAPKTARVLVDGTEKVISASQVNIGDHILVKPGETIPVDGKILSGETSVNQAVMTGESMPVAKTAGDEVFVGTINQHGAIEIETTKIGADSSLGKMISLVKEAEEKKARVVRIADKWAGYIVPVALFIAILVYFGGASLSQGMVILASHHKTGSQYYNQIQRAVTVLVVFCPCALVLATPTAMMAAIGNATKKGILIKSGEALELMSRITAIAFDKTGTITEGKPAVVSTLCFNGSRENELISLAASAERLSEHHLGQAVIRFAEQKGIETLPADNFLMHSGKGISVNIKGYPVFVGNIRLMEENGIAISEDEKEQVQEQQKNGKTVLLVSDQKHLLGFISVADTVKKNARDSVLKLKNAGIKNVVLITGDNEVTANAIATQTDIVNVYSSQLPEDKVNVVKKLMENSSVAMVGDGVNDAPALATANVGIAMGAMGTDIAIEAADIALMSDELERLPELIDLSKKTMSTIKINIIISMCINALAITAAAAGILNPAMGAIVHNAGSVLVVANSAMMLKYKLNQ
ncbi:MAG: cation-translocating P-type ATPase [Bacillota bacterium]|nr:cation-translocating P-type ATPase [Bacillota bacterium]